ncbi:hypothetical protein HY632_05065 [Candidatus Uhrbacteria bacterium]|nr:hypothetical protein [Candidatus Uhrbacteria bacterium]
MRERPWERAKIACGFLGGLLGVFAVPITSEAHPLLATIANARAEVQAATTEAKWCVTRQRVRRRWRVRGSNCSVVAAAVGVPQQGTWKMIAFFWNADTPDVGAYRLERVGPRKGVNTQFLVRRRIARGVYVAMGDAILAWKIPIRQRSGTWTTVVYTPYSEALHRPELITVGEQMLAREIQSARARLVARGVRSTTFSDQLVTAVIPAATTETITVVEKIDHDEFADCQRSEQASVRAACLQRLMEVPYVVLAVNGDDAYRCAVSGAGARGYMQFMRGTWSMIQRAYPAAELPSFAEGAHDHVVSIMAAILLNDYNLRFLEEPHRTKLGAEPEFLTLFSAAAYNGNPKWAKKAIARCGVRWMDVQHCGILRRETAVYLQKVGAVWPTISMI